jgi:hypothetical protein
MTAREVTRHGDFEVATTPAIQGGGFMVWAKMGAITGTSPIDEPGSYVWFDHGATREEARSKILAELGLTR